MKLDYRQIGLRIRKQRIKARMSQEQLAEAIEASPQYISHIETARKKASLEMIVNIANVLDTSVDQLIAGNQTLESAELSRLVSGCTAY